MEISGSPFVIQSHATRTAIRANLFVRGTARERPGASGRHGVGLVGHGRQPPQPAMRAGQPALDGLAQVGQQMPPVGDVRQRQPAEQAQHGVGAGRHGQPGQQPRTRFAAQRSARPALRLGQPACAPGEGHHQLRYAFGEGLTGTSSVAAVEPTHAQADPDRTPE